MVSRVAMSMIRDAQSGQAEAQLAVGKLYLNGGSGLKQDNNTAFYWLRKAASAGSMEAKRLIGSGAATLAHNDDQASQRTSGHESPNADLALADWLLTGQIPANDEITALEVLRRAASHGEKRAQLRLAILLQASNQLEEAEEAAYWLERAAEQGSKAAAARLADWYWERFDPASGAWLEKVAQTGEHEVLYRLGVMRATVGRTVDGSAPIAKAALLGNRGALLHYGLLHTLPLGRAVTGVANSLKKAAFWLEKASHGGSGHASFELAQLYRLRQFSLKNAALAHKYLETAARQGHAQAQYLLALANLRDSVGRDSDIAAAGWLLAAARQGHAAAASIARLLYARKPAPTSSVTARQSRIVKMLSRTRIALAARLEVASAFRLTIPELLLIDPDDADRTDFLVLDLRRHMRRAKRRIVAIDSPEERSLLDRARRLLSTSNPHPTDVRGALAQRKLDLQQSIRVFGSELNDMGWSE